MRRFSLRALMLAMTAICVFCAFCAYEVQWINERRDYVLEADYGRDWATIGGLSRQFVVTNNPHYSDSGGPYLLWLFGEKSVEGIPVWVGISDVTRASDRIATIKRSHPALKRAKRLFPEAKFYYVGCTDGLELEIEVVD